jgi:hypothetical protein
MLPIPTDSKEFIALLNSHDVKYVIVGGYAVAFHGHPRMTGDIDIFVESSLENAGKLERVLNAFGFAGLGLTAGDFREPETIIQLGFPPNRIAIITSLSGVDFATAWDSRVSHQDEGLSMCFIDKPNLLANKLASGRPKDLADRDALS